MDEQFGIVIKQQQEISLSMSRRIYDNILPDKKDKQEDLPEEEKKEYLLNEMIKNLPQVPFIFLIPEAIIEYCSKAESPISDELKQVMLQPDNFLFIPIEFVTKSSREIIIKSENIIQTGEILPYFNPRESNMINDHLSANTDVDVKDIFGNKIGKAHSVIYHPDKGYFIVIENDFVDDFIYEQIYKLLHGEIVPAPERAKTLTRKEMKKATIDEFAQEFEKSAEEIMNIEFFKRILIEKNTGILPEKVENSKYSLISLGNVKIISDSIIANYGSPMFGLSEIFDLEGKVVENVKGTEIGVVYDLKLLKKPVLHLWTSIDLMLIASLISDTPEKLFSKDQNFIDNLAISIGKQLSIAPQIALRPDIVMIFMNLSGKISDIDYLGELMEKFNPKSIELTRIISVDKRKILADISDEEIMEEIYTDIEVGEIDDEHRYVTSPDYFLREQ